jgi:hypothetical protein
MGKRQYGFKMRILCQLQYDYCIGGVAEAFALRDRFSYHLRDWAFLTLEFRSERGESP